MAETLNNTIDRIDDEKKKVDVLWIDFLAGKSPVNPIIHKKYATTYATFYKENRKEAIRNEIAQIDLDNEAQYKQNVVDRFPDLFITGSIKLRPIDDNWKKVKNSSNFCPHMKWVI